MGQKAIIRMGDRTSHGGTVVEGHQLLVIRGKPAAGVGHRVHCPKCSGSPVIVEGAMNASIMGISIAVEGMKTSCGATLIASQVTDTIQAGSGSGSASGAPGESTVASAAGAAGAAMAADAARGASPADAATAADIAFDDHYVLVDADTGEILARAEYAIVRASGQVEHGVSDAEGKTHLLSSTAKAEDIDIYV